MLLVFTCNAISDELDDEHSYSRAMEQYEAKQYRDAVITLKKLIQRVPENSAYHHLLGKCYGRIAEKSSFLTAFTNAKKTLKSFEKAVQLDKTNIAAIEDLIRYYQQAPGFLGGSSKKAKFWQNHLEILKSSGQKAVTSGNLSQP